MFLNMSFFAILLGKIELNWIEKDKTMVEKDIRSAIIQIDNGIKYIIFEKYENWKYILK